MRIRTWVCALVVSVATAGVAAADDAPGWGGWYGGAYGGYIFGDFQAEDPDHFETTGDFDDDGAMAGIYVGRRSQKANRTVIGFELTLPLFMEKGTAVDKEFYPDLVTYEGDPKLGAFGGVQVGKAMGSTLPYLFASVGVVSGEGKTFNVDENDAYSPGFVQSATATHFAWQAGAGLDCRAGAAWLIGARAAYFQATKADYTMPWNRPGPNKFGLNAVQVQFNVGRQF